MLLLLLALAVAGQGVKYLITRPGEAPGGVQVLASLTPGSPTAQRDSAKQLARPLGPAERINVDLAPAAELARLPRVGPRLAKIIIADRERNGPFGSVEGLDRVPGIGPGLLAVIGSHVQFGRAPGATVAIPFGAPLPPSPAAPLNINSASLKDLDALPGIGPSRAAAIIRHRESHGPFRSPADLGSVPGLTGATLRRLQERVVAR